MNETERKLLSKKLRTGLLAGYETVKQETGYNATYFLQMVQETDDGAAVAKRLLAKSDYSAGLTRLWELGRLDLSVENLILSPEFAPLFTNEELAVARQRLLDYGFDPDKR